MHIFLFPLMFFLLNWPSLSLARSRGMLNIYFRPDCEGCDEDLEFIDRNVPQKKGPSVPLLTCASCESCVNIKIKVCT